MNTHTKLSIRAAIVALFISACASFLNAQTVSGTAISIYGGGEVSGSFVVGGVFENNTVAYFDGGFVSFSNYNLLYGPGGTQYLEFENRGPGGRSYILGNDDNTGGNIPGPGFFLYDLTASSAIFEVDTHQTFKMIHEASAPHYSSYGSTPTVGAGGAAGTGGSFTIYGTDSSGTIWLTEGTAPSNIGLATITFATAYTGAVRSVTLTPANPITAALYGANTVYVPDAPGLETIGPSGFFLCVAGGSLTPGAQYEWYYRVN